MVLKNLQKSTVEFRDYLVTWLAPPSGTSNATLLKGFRIVEFLKSLPHGVTIARQHAGDLTDAATTELGRFNRGISMSIFFRKTLVK